MDNPQVDWQPTPKSHRETAAPKKKMPRRAPSSRQTEPRISCRSFPVNLVEAWGRLPLTSVFPQRGGRNPPSSSPEMQPYRIRSYSPQPLSAQNVACVDKRETKGSGFVSGLSSLVSLMQADSRLYQTSIGARMAGGKFQLLPNLLVLTLDNNLLQKPCGELTVLIPHVQSFSLGGLRLATSSSQPHPESVLPVSSFHQPRKP